MVTIVAFNIVQNGFNTCAMATIVFKCFRHRTGSHALPRYYATTLRPSKPGLATNGAVGVASSEPSAGEKAGVKAGEK